MATNAEASPLDRSSMVGLPLLKFATQFFTVASEKYCSARVPSVFLSSFYSSNTDTWRESNFYNFAVSFDIPFPNFSAQL